MSGDQLDLDAIEARAMLATGGPWERNGLSDVEGSVATFHRVGPTPARIAIVLTDFQRDADFIAHAREDVPALVAEVRRLREMIAPPCSDCQYSKGHDRCNGWAWDLIEDERTECPCAERGHR